jgi:hypothetical protein
MQAMLINRAVYERSDPGVFLSPRQLKILAYIEEHNGKGWKNRINEPNFTLSWKDILKEIEVFKQ